MAETIKTTEHYYTKEFGNYSNSENNFVANQEITITITLNEYRSLVEAGAMAKQKIDKAESERYSRNAENDKLKAEVCKLKEKLYELQNEKIEKGTDSDDNRPNEPFD